MALTVTQGSIGAMTEPSKAVFLSYASQDAGAARRICESLRAAGIEVWFDQSELRGGDVWDHRIRQQIQDCALFIPVISAHTDERTEGYLQAGVEAGGRPLLPDGRRCGVPVSGGHR